MSSSFTSEPWAPDFSASVATMLRAKLDAIKTLKSAVSGL